MMSAQSFTSYLDGEWRDVYSYCFIGPLNGTHQRIDITGNKIRVEHFSLIQELGVVPRSNKTDPEFVEWVQKEYMPKGEMIAQHWREDYGKHWKFVGIVSDAHFVSNKGRGMVYPNGLV